MTLAARAMCRTALMASMALATAPAFADQKMTVPEDEMPRLKACEAKACKMILTKDPKGDDLTCKLSKTWAQDTIKGGESKAVRWGFGDARCNLNLTFARSEIVSALTKPEHTINIPEQTVRCDVIRSGEVKPVTVKLAPTLKFKKGKADKVWINLKDFDGPGDIKATVWTAANLEDSLGIFHRGMIKSINKFLYKRCNEQYGPNAALFEMKRLADEKKKAEAAAAKKGALAAPAPAKSEAAAATPEAKPAPEKPAAAAP